MGSAKKEIDTFSKTFHSLDFYVDESDDDVRAFLKFVGRFVTVRQVPNTEEIKHIYMDHYRIDWTDWMLQEKLTRKAGKRLTHSSRSIGEVYTYRQDHTTKETADYAGLEFRTFQRRVARHKADGTWHEGSSKEF